MTTIATDGKSMAGDGQASASGTIVSINSRKVHRLKCGRLYGTCGDAANVQAHRRWLENGCEGDAPKLNGDFGFIILSRDGTVQQGGSDGIPVETAAPTALGSGMDLAIGAMDAGKSAAEAVAIAAGRDPNTGGVITELELEPLLSLVGGSGHQ